MDQSILVITAVLIVGIIIILWINKKFSLINPANANELNEIKQTNALLEQASKTVQTALEQEKERTLQLNEEVKALTSQSATLSGENTQLKANVAELQKKVEIGLSDIATSKKELNQLQLNMSEKKAQLEAEAKRFEAQQKDFEKQKNALSDEFKVLSEKILKSRQDDLKKQNEEDVKSLLKPLEEQLKGFKNQVESAHNESIKNHSSLKTQIENVMEMGLKMSDEANNLSSALKGKSQARGAWGEAMLEQSLEMSGLIKNTHYTAQNTSLDEDQKRKRPDILIKVPGGKNLIIDSKVTLKAYDALVSAETEEEEARAMAEHIKAVKSHMDDLSGKNYDQIAEFRSPDYVLMFMPIEAAYIEALKHDKDLYAYGFRKRVVLVSHTTLIPILRTVANLWTIDQGNKAAKEIADKAGDIYNTVAELAENVLKMGSQLKTVSGTYNKVVNKLSGQRGLYGKIERFSQTSERVKKQLPDVQPQYIDYETEKLEALELPAEETNE